MTWVTCMKCLLGLLNFFIFIFLLQPSIVGLLKIQIFYFLYFSFYEDSLASRPVSQVLTFYFILFYFYVKFCPYSFNFFFLPLDPIFKLILFSKSHPSTLNCQELDLTIFLYNDSSLITYANDVKC